MYFKSVFKKKRENAFGLFNIIFVSVFLTLVASCTYDKREVPELYTDDCIVVPEKIIVNVLDYMFEPAEISAHTGDTIEWVWNEGTHTTTSKPGIPANADSWDIIIDKNSFSYKYILKVEGIYHYECTPHAPAMSGTITVTKSKC